MSRFEQIGFGKRLAVALTTGALMTGAAFMAEKEGASGFLGVNITREVDVLVNLVPDDLVLGGFAGYLIWQALGPENDDGPEGEGGPPEPEPDVPPDPFAALLISDPAHFGRLPE